MILRIVLICLFSIPLLALPDWVDVDILSKLDGRYRFGYEIEIQEKHLNGPASSKAKILPEKENEVLERLRLWSSSTESILEPEVLHLNLSEYQKQTIKKAKMGEFQRREIVLRLDWNLVNPEFLSRLFHVMHENFDLSFLPQEEQDFFKITKSKFDSTAYREYVLDENKIIIHPEEFLNTVEAGMKALGVWDELKVANKVERSATYHHHFSRGRVAFPAIRVNALHDYKLVKLLEQTSFNTISEFQNLNMRLFSDGIDVQDFGTNLRDGDRRIEEKFHVFGPREQLVFSINVMEYPDETELLKKLYSEILSNETWKELLIHLVNKASYKLLDKSSYSRNKGAYYGAEFLRRLYLYAPDQKRIADAVSSLLLDKNINMDSMEKFLGYFLTHSNSEVEVKLWSEIIKSQLKYQSAERLERFSSHLLPYAEESVGFLPKGEFKSLMTALIPHLGADTLKRHIYSIRPSVSKSVASKEELYEWLLEAIEEDKKSCRNI